MAGDNTERWKKLNVRCSFDEFSLFSAAVVLSLTNVLLLIITGHPYALTTTLAVWGAAALRPFGIEAGQWVFFQKINIEPIVGDLLRYHGTFLVLGTILGAALSAAFHGRLWWRPVKSIGRGVTVFAGGFLMGYGARLASGCNVGALWDGIASSSLHGWIFALFMVLGAIFCLKILQLFY